ncbi:MAG: lytic transglycosylase domain-containing protein, partial [Verrucomicrobiae bacterium]|nr:lytic transglycosylase domain-containing protein [Verrucomicrobiae bacterium]
NFRALLFTVAVLFLAVTVVQELRLRRWMDQNRYDEIILRASMEYGTDPNLIKAVILRESKFDPDTLGTVGEKGLMQVTDTVYAEWARLNKVVNVRPSDLFEPDINIRVGTWYLRKSINNWNKADDPVPFALAEYNAGRKNVLRWLDNQDRLSGSDFVRRIGFPTTQQYVKTILQQRDYYASQGEF